MTSLFAKLTLLLYVSAVGFGIVDQALYGPGDHDHNGQPCRVHQFASQSEAPATPAVSIPAPPVVSARVVYQDSAAQLTAARFLLVKSRDPPAVLFS
jgi:hypothetical protein